MNEPHHVRWKSMISLGVISVLLGLFMLFFSNFATQVFVALTGFAIILLSAIFIVEGLCIDAEGWPRWGILSLGALGFILGVASIAVPSLLIFSTGVILGIFFLIYGIGELAIGVGIVFVETMVRLVFIMLGILSMVVGIFLVLNPTIGLDIFVWLVGLYLLVLGLMRIAHGLNERDAEQKITIKHL
jgi:uncharacterized membrane protein HdeD (DUF308 family)